MVRRKKEDALVTRSKIIDAAEDVFYEKGFSLSTLQDIADIAGVTRGAIYWHFKDKNELFHAICERVITPVEETFAKSIKEDTAIVKTLKNICINNFKDVALNERKQKVLSIMLFKYEYVSEAELVFKREKDGKAKFVKYIAALLKKAQEKGEIGKSEDIEMLAYCLHVFIMGIYKDFLINVNEDSPKEHWVNLIELFFYKNFSI